MSDFKNAINAYKKGSVKPEEKKSLKPETERYVFRQFENKPPLNSEYFVRETENREKPKKYSKEGMERVAKLLVLLGKDEAASVLKSFSGEEIERIASEVLKIKKIDKGEAAELLKIIHRKNTKAEIFSGGVETARDILVQAFGKEKGDLILKKSLPEKREIPFDFLNDLEPLQVKLAIKKESPTVAAIILNYLNPDKSALLLKEYSPEEQKDLIMKMGKGGRISRDVIEKIEEGLKKRIREQGNIVTQEIDGKSRLAGILKFMDPEKEEEILNEISELSPDLSKEIDSRIFSIDIVNDIPDIDFQKLLNNFSETEIAVLLKGRDSRIKKKFLKNISQQRKELVMRESDFIGIIRKSEVNRATTEFIDYIRQMEKDGGIIINRGGTLYV